LRITPDIRSEGLETLDALAFVLGPVVVQLVVEVSGQHRGGGLLWQVDCLQVLLSVELGLLDLVQIDELIGALAEQHTLLGVAVPHEVKLLICVAFQLFVGDILDAGD
jgi:hypothetical protein